MKSTLLLLTFIFLYGTTKTQEITNEPLKSEPLRYIEVTGSAELEVEPDEIRLIIGIEEYWKEEFEKSTKFKDYKTNVEINEIEHNLMDDLLKIGIKKEQLIVREVGNYWRYIGKEFLFSKQFELALTDFRKVDEITKTVNTKGINYMRIGELKSNKITEYRKQVKIEALKAAKTKAEYLLTSIGKRVGDVISIVELSNENNFYWRQQPLLSNTMMTPSDNSENDNVRKIKLRYEIKVRFEII